MKQNTRVLIKKICIINFICIISSCSTFKSVKNNYPDTNMDNSKYICLNTNKIITDELTRLQIQKLQSTNIIYFPLDQYYILPIFFETLNMHANFLCNNSDFHIKIEGHTDERGTPEYNIALGERRAHSVKLYLQSKGVLSSQIRTVSYGKEKLISFGHTEEDHYKNRRSVLIY